jgi:hypothetical protein
MAKASHGVLQHAAHMKAWMLSGVLFAGGCDKGSDDCKAAMDHAAEIANLPPDMKADELERAKYEMGELRGAALERCRADKWQPDVTDCIKHAVNSHVAQSCFDKLTPTQRGAFEAVEESTRERLKHAGSAR